jgi:lysophospholipase L1-like esterase
LDWLVIIVMSLAFAVACTAVVTSRGRDLLSRRCFQLLACTIASICVWLAAECLIYAFAVPVRSNTPHRRAPNTVSLFHPAPGVMPGIDGDSHFTVNSLGIRGPELPPRSAAYRILCVGGSTTECLYLDDSEAWPHLLMNELKAKAPEKPVWVGNIGISGYSTVHHVRFLSEDPLWKEMDCLLFMVGANDLGTFLRFGLAMRSPWDEFEEKERQLALLQPDWKKSPTIKTARYVYRELTRPRMHVEDAAGRNYAVRRAIRQSAVVRDNMPDLTAALDQYEARIVRLIELCKVSRVRPVFLSQPTLFGENTPNDAHALFWSGDDAQGRYFKVEDLARGLEQYNLRLEYVCDREGVLCVDLGSINDHPEFFYDEFHFNEAGARAVGKLVANGIIDHVGTETLTISTPVSQAR